ncbi:MAG: Bacterial alpha-L-rhamnosidase [Phycisphaera sp.]|nr:Bacterial alpha-L-rhamnosidase [Phycisphaera sp.]
MSHIKFERFSLPAAPLAADNNIRHQYPIHKGKWVRHPHVNAADPNFCHFTLGFTLEAGATIDLHVSADCRFEMFCDGQFMGMGPDRADLEHWSFHSYRVSLEAGRHTLLAEVYFSGVGPMWRPWAQTCIEPGFVLFAENSPIDLNTGSAPWKVTKLNGVTPEKAALRGFFVVGPNYRIDGKAFFTPPAAVDPVVVRDSGRHNESGTIQPGWKLYPTRLPEQLRRPVGGGRVRCVSDIADDAPFPHDDAAPDPRWQAFVEGRAPVTVPANTRTVVLWDLDEYHCVYPELTTTGGTGAQVKIEWAESCYETQNAIEVKPHANKGHRGQVKGKTFLGYGDTFLPDGPKRTFHTFWWRAGRYARITVQTGGEPLTLEALRVFESRMPIENNSTFTGSDADLQPVVKLATRGIQMCSHETFMDCPYYEQLMYSGDTRIQMLTAYVMNSEDRLVQRGLEIFDWSRQETGFVHERTPSQPKQLSCTFSMIWVLMLRDYLYWRNNPAFLMQRVKGMRCMLEEFKALPDTHSPLLPALPGWSFMDWVDHLSFVNNPGPNQSVSSLVNLLFVNALNAAAEVETHLGEKHLADYNRAWASRIAGAVEEKFWNKERNLFAEDPAHTRYSEHAQCLALLSGYYPHLEAGCFESLITAPDLLRTTVYFMYYLLETYAKFGRGDLILKKFDFWKQMVAMGMKTPLESPEPSRSDCHAWSSHPLFHMHASLAGIQPASPGFKSVRITPSPGSLTEISSVIPHPAGKVELAMKLVGGQWKTQVKLPEATEGTLYWKGQTHKLSRSTDLTLQV